jgi:hypothetical protein
MLSPDVRRPLVHFSSKLEARPVVDIAQELAGIRAQLASLEHRFASLAIGFFGIAGIMIWSKLMGWI